MDQPTVDGVNAKMTLTLPFDLWLKGELRGFIEESLFGSSIFKRHFVRRFWADSLKQGANWPKPWALTVLGRFLN